MLELFTTDWRQVWAKDLDTGDVGVVYTKPEIVELILDLVGYTPKMSRLADQTLLEPSCGDGAFLAAVVDRLVESERVHKTRVRWENRALESAICAVDLSETAVSSARRVIVERLTFAGCPKPRARALAAKWAVQGDFLLQEWDRRFDFVVGNPPYVRLEDLPKRVLAEYRRRFETLTDRADVYIAFFEQGLRLLSATGSLAFICANRFAKNQYGAELRKLISESFRVRHYVNLEHTQPFLTDVSAYPAIVTIDRQRGKRTLAGTLQDVETKTLDSVRAQALGVTRRGPLNVFSTWYSDGAPWSTTSAKEAATLNRLSQRFALLEDSARSTRVGIGVATGADGIFILKKGSTAIEQDRLIPLAVPRDVSPSGIQWSGHRLVNPFAAADDGQLIDLNDYPGLAAHFHLNREVLQKRHVAKSRPASWFRTIDRVWPTLTGTPKLLLPDIQIGGNVALDTGKYYPSHNLYFVISAEWDLSALQALLRSSHVLLQVRAFSVQMRGGSVRYQAQTLRRVRVPTFHSLPPRLVDLLRDVSTSNDQMAIDDAASEAFGESTSRLASRPALSAAG
ncbi:MAG TPA: class I SAM-dependent methyltransferase [Gemmatimonadaceae bacterium]|nr:class I SAM-dependent methyltransferase [Gemmatimonadaceae bacterium]HRQ77177.1 class I SAM-dependent methyltransferase [Gemmatimonadaceae bacterium]